MEAKGVLSSKRYNKAARRFQGVFKKGTELRGVH